MWGRDVINTQWCFDRVVFISVCCFACIIDAQYEIRSTNACTVYSCRERREMRCNG